MPDRISPDVLAAALRGQGHQVHGPNWRGVYTASTALCHGGDDDGKNPHGLTISPSNTGGFIAGCFTRNCGKKDGSLSQGDLGKKLLALAGIEREWKPADYREDEFTQYIAAVYQHPDGSSRKEYRRNWPKDWPKDQQTCPYKPAGKEPCGKPQEESHPHRWTAGGGQSGVLARVNILDPSKPIIIAEGAKAANALALAGYNTANWFGGAGAIRKADLSPLHGLPLILWPDNDPSGLGEWSMRWAAYILREECPDISIVPPYYAGGDKSDAADCPAGELAAHIAKAQPYRVDQQPPESRPTAARKAAAPGNPPPGAGRNGHPPGKSDWLGKNRDFIQSAGQLPHTVAVRLLAESKLNPVLVYDQATDPGVPATAAIYTWTDSGRLEHSTGRVQSWLNDCRWDVIDEILADGTDKAVHVFSDAAKIPEWLPKVCAAMPGVVESLRRHHPEIPLSVYPPADLDTDRNLLGCANGVLDIAAGRLLTPEEARLRPPVTANTGVDWNANARDADIDLVLPPVPAPGLTDWQAYLGWCIVQPPRRDFAIETGPKGGGKTTRRLAILGGLGSDYVKDARPESLQRSKFNRGGTAHNGDLLGFGNPARIIFAPDASGGYYDTALINRMAGGEGMLQARDCGEKVKSLRISAHLIIQSNDGNSAANRLHTGVGADDANAEALIDRLRLFVPPTIPPDKVKPGLLKLLEPGQIAVSVRQAALKRLVEYAQAVLRAGYDSAPRGLDMQEHIDRRRDQESPEWQKIIGPRILLRSNDMQRPLDSYTVRQEAVDISKDNLEPKPAAHTITKWLTKAAGGQSRPGKIRKQDNPKQWANTVFFDEFTLEQLGGEGEDFF